MSSNHYIYRVPEVSYPNLFRNQAFLREIGLGILVRVRVSVTLGVSVRIRD